MSMIHVINSVMDERIHQEQKWGPQNWPSFDQSLPLPDRLASLGVCFTEAEAKANCDTAHKEGRLLYSHIFMEEVIEALSATTPKDLREELVQVAAVTVAWIESLDRNGR